MSIWREGTNHLILSLSQIFLAFFLCRLDFVNFKVVVLSSFILFRPSFFLWRTRPDQSILNFPLVYSPGGQKPYEEINWSLMRLLSEDERERWNTNCLNHKLSRQTEHHLYRKLLLSCWLFDRWKTGSACLVEIWISISLSQGTLTLW